MKIEPLPLDGLFRIIPEPVHDIRGLFARCFSSSALAAAGLETEFVEWSVSNNIRGGTLRGLHFQAAPHLETKLVQCVRGAIFDVAVDLRPNSPTRGKWYAVELSAANRHMLYIPKGFAHGYQTLADDTEILYYISEVYHPEASRGIRWNDPDLAITWPPAPERIMSERDAKLPLLAELDAGI